MPVVFPPPAAGFQPIHPGLMSMYNYPMPPPHYSYGAPPLPPPRQYPGHGTSSAFSSSANPDEDWTKISDLAERRRIQNRIAQRNYRKKLKRRLEDLERRAGEDSSTSGSEKQAPTKSSATKRSSTKSRKSSPATTTTATATATATATTTTTTTAPPANHSPFTPPMHHDDALSFFPGRDEGRRKSQTPPPLFTFSSYPPPEELALAPPYPAPQPYPSPNHVPGTYATYLSVPPPVTLPPMDHFSDAVKRDSYPSDEQGLPCLGYGYPQGMEIAQPNPYDHSAPHSPPLSDAFDHSASCSDTGYEYPTTPLSIPGSPGTAHGC